MTRDQLEAVIERLTDLVGGWNDAAEDGDRGRANHALCLTIYDDGSGFLGTRRSYDGPDGCRVNDIQDVHEFKDYEDLFGFVESK